MNALRKFSLTIALSGAVLFAPVSGAFAYEEELPPVADAASAPATKGELLRIVVPSQFDIAAPKVYLKDVAQFEGGSDESKKTVGEILLGDMPPAGKTLIVRQQIIAEKIYTALGSMYNFSLAMLSPTIVLRYPTRELAADEIQNQIVSYLQQNFSDDATRVVVQDIFFNRKVLVPEDGELSVSISHIGRPVAGKMVLNLELSGANHFRDIFQVPIQMQLLQGAVQAKNDIPTGAVISESDLVVADVDVTNANVRPITDIKAVAGRVADMPIRRYTMITDRMVKVFPIVKRGAPVQMIAQGASFQITVAGVAQQNGNMNDTVRVMNAATKKIVMGTVVDNDTVAVPF